MACSVDAEEHGSRLSCSEDGSALGLERYYVTEVEELVKVGFPGEGIEVFMGGGVMCLGTVLMLCVGGVHGWKFGDSG